MKKLFSVVLVLCLMFVLAVPAMANPGQNPNQNPGSPAINIAQTNLRITVTGGGNNLVIRAIDLTGENADVIIPRAGNGTFNQAFDVFGYTGRIFVQGNSLLRVDIASVPYVCANICDGCDVCLDCGECECEGEYYGTPIVVNLGFIGHYIHNDRVLTTSFFWMELNEGDMIDWDAVEAAYAGWVAQGGLAPDTSNGWHSSGFAPLFFDDGAEVGHGDFSYPQLEGFYRAYFVATGYILPYVCANICEGCEICTDCGECECEGEVYGYLSDTWTGRLAVQGGNNGRIVVTVNGEGFTLNVNAQQAGTRTHTVDGFTIEVRVNDNNMVNRVVVTATEVNVTVVIDSVVSLTPGTGNSQS